MSVGPGTSFGHFEILESIGAGGMGEVYRARDSKLERDVAIKILPDAFARDSERLGRFQREARLLAALNRPKPISRTQPPRAGSGGEVMEKVHQPESSLRGATEGSNAAIHFISRSHGPPWECMYAFPRRNMRTRRIFRDLRVSALN